MSIWSSVVLSWYWIFDRLLLYPIMKYISPKLGINFMNLGYWPCTKHDEALMKFAFLNDEFNASEDKAHILLYEKALSMHPKYPAFDGSSILEVSCGRGNGLTLIEKWHGKSISIIGCDKMVHQQNGKVVFGDAMDLPFQEESFDIVLNVEASHLYYNCQKFFNECKRVLRPGGKLCWLDLRYPDEMEMVQNQASHAGLILEFWQDITKNVLLGIKKTSRKYDNHLQTAPFFIKLFSGSIRSTYCAPGTTTYKRLEDGKRVYIAAMWKK